jgi:hypothetical protein
MWVICGECNGSGEGRGDGANCSGCFGSGQEWVQTDESTDQYREEESHGN